MYKGKLAVIHIETTGFDIYNDAITQFTALILEDGQITDSLDASSLEQNVEKVTASFANAVCVGHHVQFGLAILERTLGAHLNNPVWDTQELVRIFFPCLNQYHLIDCEVALEIGTSELENQALSKAWITWKILEKCWNKAVELDLSFFQRALPLASGSGSDHFLQVLQHEISKTFPGRLISTEVVTLNADSGLFEDMDMVAPPQNVEWIAECFAPGGTLEKNLAGYESRPGQSKMARAVAKALVSSGHLVVEAGTGTGKSYAYLIPSLWWARKTGKKVVVATHTIPLQEQLYKKDIPVLARILPFTFKGALLKGRGNYLCLKKWLGIQNHPEGLTKEEKLAVISVMIWLRTTVSGDWQEVAQIPGLSRIWKEINADNDSCIPARCKYANSCFMLRARKMAEEADVLVVNHSLLFSDIKTDNNVLPEYHELMIDEAHHLHQSALEQLGEEVSLESLVLRLDLLYRPTGGSLYTNVKAKKEYMSKGIPIDVWEQFLELCDELPFISTEILQQATELFATLDQVLAKELTLRLTKEHQNQTWWSTFAVQIENLQGRLSKGIQALKSMQNLLTGLESEEADELIFEVSARIRDLEDVRECFAMALKVDDPSRVVWLEKSNRLTLKTSPVDVSELLKNKLFSKLDSAVLTSATISISGSFQHFLSEVGLKSSTPTQMVESPFDFERQMRFMIIKDLLTTKNSEQYNLQDIVDFIAEVSGRMQGRTLVLFTSHSLLREIYSPLNRNLEVQGLKLLAQGIDGSRKAILEEFMKNSNSVLMGANSFWEGIDIPGDKLMCVILIKLPFWAPSMPLIAARSEYLELKGKNAFQDFLLPEAVLRFKQGFGRLIRSKLDRGLVILCDARVIDKRYGRVFLSSLPVQTHLRIKREQTIDQIDRWFEEQYNEELLS